MNSFTNPWIAGIAAGIISGILVAWISSLFLSRRNGSRRNGNVSSEPSILKEPSRLEKTATANREILQAIRLAAAEGQIPRRDAIAALTNATARRYGLAPPDLYQTTEIAEDLIKDVMESGLLSASKKSDLCAQLSYLLLTLPGTENVRVGAKISGAGGRGEAASEVNNPGTQRVSALTGILAGVLSGVFAGRELLGKYLGAIPHGLRIGLEALAGIAAALAALLIVALVFGDAPDSPQEPPDKEWMFNRER